MKMYFLEGLPGIGKTTLINYIRALKKDNLFVVDEIINKEEINSQNFFMENDMLKIKKYKKGNIIIDRGAISTLSYNECVKGNKELNKVNIWFNKNFKELYNRDFVKTIYLIKTNHNYLIRNKSANDPYGNIENQRELEKTTIKNIKKYCKNYKILNIDNLSKDDILNEIIN